MPTLKDTQAMRDDVLEIRAALREGKLTNTVARTLIMASKVVYDSLKLEIEAARLGADFKAVDFHQEDRNKPKLREAA